MALCASDISDLIGIPFKYGGRDEFGLDCYGLVKVLYEREGHFVPDYFSPTEAPAITHQILSGLTTWERVEVKPGAMLVFRVPSMLHVAYYLGHDQMIHAWEGSGGVTIERFSFWQKRLIGAYVYTDKKHVD